MSDLKKAYDAKDTEPKWLEFWKNKFTADPFSSKPAYSIVIPPPNVTGALHMGHALVNTLQDVLIRRKRMQGFETLWLPGTDHAGIATQTIVERKLIRETGKRRVDFEREEFLKHVWKWKEENEDRIVSQLKLLGCSCDWSRQRFTMDEKNNRAVSKTFEKLYNEGLIYRGDYLVNWDPVTQTALADDEVEYEERQGFIYTLIYPVEGSTEKIHIATTRPETMLGDTAVAVSPKDERYRSFVGKNVLHPITGRKIPILADPFVDPEFGTGAVKITPAHDMNDYEMAQRHHLPLINIMTKDGRINEMGGVYQGLLMREARDKIVEDLKKQGCLAKIDPHQNRVGVSYRSKAVIEPFMSKQWFIKMSAFKDKMKSAVRDSRIKLIPKQWENTYFHWIDNLRDWCISRQLWWGHRIPIYYKKTNPDEMICSIGKDPGPEWEQDPDVLDTWFSSALWPFAAFGWPENTPELQKFYPTSVLVTGHDILFFWVARMIMMGEKIMEAPPFKETFLHGLIFGKSYWRQNSNGIAYVTEEERKKFDEGEALPKDVQFKWEKMSKSKGNIIDPIEIINEFGTDALRMTLCSSGCQAREIDLDRRKFEDYRNFTNKVWNGARFVFMQIEGLDYDHSIDENLFTLEDKLILSRLNHTIEKVNLALDKYEFDQAAQGAYDFFWKDFCSYYVEIVKPVLFGKMGTPEERKNKQKLLLVILGLSVRLLHPMAPFITEELFSIIKERFPKVSGSDPYTLDLMKSLESESVAFSTYPHVIREKDIDQKIEERFSKVEQAIYTIRNIRGEMKLPPSASPPIYIKGDQSDPLYKILHEDKNLILGLIKTEGLHFGELPNNGFMATGVIESVKIAIPLPQDMIAQEKNRLLKEQEKLKIQIEKLSKQLENADFVNRAPPELIQKTKFNIENSARELQVIESKIKEL